MQAVADRLGGVEAFGGRIFGAARLEALRASGALGQATPAAFVIPMGIRGGRVTDATGLFIQGVERVVGVVLVYRHAGDNTGAKAIDTIEPLIDAVVDRLCGWAPDGVLGDFRLSRGELVAMLPGGTLIFQLDFAVDDQLRIS